MAWRTAGRRRAIGAPRLSARGALSHIARPQLTVWRPALPGHGVLIAAGGGYRRIEMAKEAWPAARWLTARGYAAYPELPACPAKGGAPARWRRCRTPSGRCG
jgi:hypothetical protein